MHARVCVYVCEFVFVYVFLSVAELVHAPICLYPLPSSLDCLHATPSVYVFV